MASESGGDVMATSSKKQRQVMVKLNVDGDMARVKVVSKGVQLTRSFIANDNKEALSWLTETFDDFLREMKQEVADGTTR